MESVEWVVKLNQRENFSDVEMGKAVNTVMKLRTRILLPYSYTDGQASKRADKVLGMNYIYNRAAQYSS